LDKVLPLLEALEASKKNISFYALDLSFSELQSTMKSFPYKQFEFVKIGALHGTFEDGVQWLKNTPEVQDRPHCLLLFGLTVGNYSRLNAANFLQSIATSALAASPAESSIFLSLDSCKVPTKVLRAYTAEGVVPFALASLDYGNTLFAPGKGENQVFQPSDWHFLSEWNYMLGRHEASLITKGKEVRLGSPLNDIVVGKHEKVRFGCSYKYDADELQELFGSAGLTDVKEWSVEGCDVTFYQLQMCSH
jgi:4-dimethylallyltryptophan N-methyltransferase